MPTPMPTPTTTVKAFTTRLVDISRRLARFEPVSAGELAELAAQRDALLSGQEAG